MLAEPRCRSRGCKHFFGFVRDQSSDKEDKGKFICAAFPRGIPKEILYGDNDHTRKVRGDHGITFEKGERYKIVVGGRLVEVGREGKNA